MPKPKRNETVQCPYYKWKMYRREGQWYADGRSNHPSCGRHSLATISEEEARRQLVKLDRVQAVKHGLAKPLPTTDSVQPLLTVEDGFALYLADTRSRHLTERISIKTVERYETVAKNFTGFCKNHRTTAWQEVDTALLREYVAWLDSRGRSAATRYFEITTIKQCVNFLVTAKRLAETCRIKLKIHRPEDSDRYCYTPDEVGAMIAHCRNTPTLTWLGNVITALAMTGMRIGELASLRWSDIDFDRMNIKLSDERQSSARRKLGTARVLKGKRGRVIPLRDELVAMLQSLARATDGIIFRGEDGAQLDQHSTLRALKKQVIQPLAKDFPTPAGEVTGFKNGCLHSFRHYFCSASANHTTAEQMLMSWLGHRTSKVTRRYYHLHDEASHNAIGKINFLPRKSGLETETSGG